jgi:hypothetical protein
VIWELVFMLVILKIPVVYMCAVVWWAVRAVPRPPEGAARLVPVTAPAPACDWARRRARRLRDGRPPRRGSPAPRVGRPAHARARVRA